MTKETTMSSGFVLTDVTVAATVQPSCSQERPGHGQRSQCWAPHLEGTHQRKSISLIIQYIQLAGCCTKACCV